MKVLALGGYGEFGLAAVELLARSNEISRITIAGRNLARAQQAAADLGGHVDAVDAERGTLAQILVAGQIEADTGFDQALVRITAQTRIVRISADDACRSATREELSAMPETIPTD